MDLGLEKAPSIFRFFYRLPPMASSSLNRNTAAAISGIEAEPASTLKQQLTTPLSVSTGISMSAPFWSPNYVRRCSLPRQGRSEQRCTNRGVHKADTYTAARASTHIHWTHTHKNLCAHIHKHTLASLLGMLLNQQTRKLVTDITTCVGAFAARIKRGPTKWTCGAWQRQRPMEVRPDRHRQTQHCC